MKQREFQKKALAAQREKQKMREAQEKARAQDKKKRQEKKAKESHHTDFQEYLMLYQVQKDAQLACAITKSPDTFDHAHLFYFNDSDSLS